MSLTDEILTSARLESSEMELQDMIAVDTMLQQIAAQTESPVQISVTANSNATLQGNKNIWTGLLPI
ncbi:hypothetical protein H9W95_06635 [Flavobacterium lindanitolerans]|nr:hypothetical protein [Flavobacterium lindanitolerans]